MTQTNQSLIAAVLVVVAAVGGGACSSSPSSTSGATTPTTAGYHPTIHPADFSATVDNPWFPLLPGSVGIFTGTKDGKAARDVNTVTDRTKTIDGVATRVVEDKLYLDGKLGETTLDYYTQDKAGTVWYFGEDTKSLDAHGNVTDTEGSWTAGVNGAEPGVFMEASPTPGHAFRQEYFAGHAEDRFQVVNLTSTVTVPFGSFHDTLLTKEWTPLEPDVLDHKYYVRGIGEVREASVKGPVESLDLVRYTTPEAP